MGIKGTAILGVGIAGLGIYILSKAQAEGSTGGGKNITIKEFNVSKGEISELSDGTQTIDISVGGILQLKNLEQYSQPRIFLNITEHGALGTIPLLQRGEIFGLDLADGGNQQVPFFRNIDPTTPSAVDFTFTLEDGGQVVSTAHREIRV